MPGGLRLASWRGGQIERAAPGAGDAPTCPACSPRRPTEELLRARGASGGRPAAAEPGAFGASAGRTGELRDELRVERIEDGRVRVARWIMRPNRGWELQQAPVMLPPKRFAEALAAAAQGRAVARGRRRVRRSGRVATMQMCPSPS